MKRFEDKLREDESFAWTVSIGTILMVLIIYFI